MSTSGELLADAHSRFMPSESCQAVVCKTTLYNSSLHLGHPQRTQLKAWWGYAMAADRQRLEGFIRRAVRAGFYPTDGPNLHQLVSDRDDALFGRIQANEHHVLRRLLPSTTSHNYGLRSRRPVSYTHLTLPTIYSV